MNLQLRAIETTDLEQRLEKVEKKLAEVAPSVDGPLPVRELDFGGLPSLFPDKKESEPESGDGRTKPG